MGESNTIYSIFSDGNIVHPDPTAPCYSEEEWDEIIDAWDANIDWRLAIRESQPGQSSGDELSSPRTEPRQDWADAAQLGREQGEAALDKAWGPTRFDSVEWEWESAEGDS